jgi:hypothetical protein
MKTIIIFYLLIVNCCNAYLVSKSLIERLSYTQNNNIDLNSIIFLEYYINKTELRLYTNNLSYKLTINVTIYN